MRSSEGMRRCSGRRPLLRLPARPRLAARRRAGRPRPADELRPAPLPARRGGARRRPRTRLAHAGGALGGHRRAVPPRGPRHRAPVPESARIGMGGMGGRHGTSGTSCAACPVRSRSACACGPTTATAAAESHHADWDAPVHPPDQRLLQEGREPHRRCLTQLHALQFRPAIADVHQAVRRPDQASDGSRDR